MVDVVKCCRTADEPTTKKTDKSYRVARLNKSLEENISRVKDAASHQEQCLPFRPLRSSS